MNQPRLPLITSTGPHGSDPIHHSHLISIVRGLGKLGEVTTGNIHTYYNRLTKRNLTLNNISHILKYMEAKGRLKGRVVSKGKFGRTTHWTVEATN